MNIKQTLFIGGVHNGKWLEVDRDNQYIMLPIYPPKIMINRSFNNLDFEELQIKTEYYRLESIMGKTELFQVYVLDEIKPDDMIRKLINGYLQKRIRL